MLTDKTRKDTAPQPVDKDTAKVPTAKEAQPEPKPATPAPQELDEKQLDKVAGGWQNRI